MIRNEDKSKVSPTGGDLEGAQLKKAEKFLSIFRLFS